MEKGATDALSERRRAVVTQTTTKAMPTQSPASHENTPSRRSRSGRSVWGAILLLALGAAVAAVALTRSKPAEPPLLARAESNPLNPTLQEGAWYWLEKPQEGDARLIRATQAGAQPLITAKEITQFDVQGKRLVWSLGEKEDWQIESAATDGGQRGVLWRGKSEPFGLKLAGDRVYWLLRLPAEAPDSGPFPPLMARIQVFSMPQTGGPPVAGAVLWENAEARVLGLHGNDLYIATSYSPTPGHMALYRLPPDGPPVRLVGEIGSQYALLTRDGTLYWVAQSRDAAIPNTMSCIRRLTKEGKPETLSDWLPVNGKLYETARGVVYVDGEYLSRAWPVGEPKQLTSSYDSPPDFLVRAVGENEMLLERIEGKRTKIALYRVPLP